ncbi:MAG: hypothetical protein IT242_02360 [Bacteroidia bacterium]|nr:hypothetical protein [Bacteroidia bacterium]
MNKERSGRITGYLFASTFVLLSIFSCKKDGPTRAVISVIDSLSRPVQGARITLWQDTAVNSTNGVKSNVRVTKTSDAAGRAEFDFELEAFLNIEAVKNADTVKSFIRLEEHETVSRTLSF